MSHKVGHDLIINQKKNFHGGLDNNILCLIFKQILTTKQLFYKKESLIGSSIVQKARPLSTFNNDKLIDVNIIMGI